MDPGIDQSSKELESAQHEIPHEVDLVLAVCWSGEGLLQVGFHGRMLDKKFDKLLRCGEEVLVSNMGILSRTEAHEEIGEVDALCFRRIW